MKIEDLLSQHKQALLKKWFHLILETYPDETARFLQKEKDPFANPVGSTIFKGIEDLFEELLKEKFDFAKASSFLDLIIRIRAVQDFTPSQAISFIFLLKKVIRAELKKELNKKGILVELLVFESKIDELAQFAFDVYMGCREKVYELKTNEIKNRYSGLLKRLNLLSEVPDEESAPPH